MPVHTSHVYYLDAPVITSSPFAPVSVPEYSTDPVTVTCTAVGEPQPDIVQKQGEDQVSDNGVLDLTNVDRSQAGEYMCVATNTMRPTDGGETPGEDTETLQVTVRCK